MKVSPSTGDTPDIPKENEKFAKISDKQRDLCYSAVILLGWDDRLH